jgi:RHS repeat-associated protein
VPTACGIYSPASNGIKEIGLYDLRNRFYSPDIGRFLQPDPIGFRGDRTNLYRHCGNNPVTRWDSFGLTDVPTSEEEGDNDYDAQEVGYGPAPDNTTIEDTHGFVDGGYGDGGGTIIGAPPGEGSGVSGNGTGGTGSDVTGGLGGNGDAGASGGLGGSGELDGISIVGSGPDGPGGQGGPGGPGGLGGFGAGPGGGAREPGGPAYDIGWLRKQLIRYRATHRADIAGNAKFANVLDRFALGTSIVVGGGALVELAGPALAAGPGGVAESLQSAAASTQVTSVSIIIGAQAATMGVTSANLHPIEDKVLQLLEEEMVPWEYWRP